MTNSRNVWLETVGLIDQYLPCLTKSTTDLIPVASKIGPNEGDWICNRRGESYERVRILVSEQEREGILLAVEIAVSVLPTPLFPSGPFGWYGHMYDLKRGAECFGSLEWSGPWMMVAKNGEDWIKKMDDFFRKLSGFLMVEINDISSTFDQKEMLVKIRNFLTSSRLALGFKHHPLAANVPSVTGQLSKALMPINFPDCEKWIAAGLELPRGFKKSNNQ